MDGRSVWQVASLAGITTWVMISSMFNVTQMVRSFTQPWATHHVVAGTSFTLQIQKFQHNLLDNLFSVLSCVVSVPFYTGFLPLLFWSGHGKLARQMTILMAFCDYIGNCIKDVVSAPRPSCPPVRRVTSSEDEIENAKEYGLPSSHTLNTVCLSGYLLYYVLSHNQSSFVALTGSIVVCLFVSFVALGRIYLGMHSLIDVIGGLVIGLMTLAFWLTIHQYVDNFIVFGQNVTSFWAALSFLLCFAYPSPELPTPSFEYHTAFNGVAFGIVAGVQQTYHHFHHEDVPRIFDQELAVSTFVGRILVGLPTILLVKFCSKVIAKWTLPVALSTMGFRIRSTSYIPSISGHATEKEGKTTQSGCLHKLFFFSNQDYLDVDTGIRFVQYAGLAWSVVDLVPSIFSRLNL